MFRLSALRAVVWLAAAILLGFSALPAFGQRSPAEDASTKPMLLGQGRAGVYPNLLRGRITASGAAYDPGRATAAHRTLPLGSVIRVIRVNNGESVVVRITDRGPYTDDRIIDLSASAARSIGLSEGDETVVRIVPVRSEAEMQRSVRVAEYPVSSWTRGKGFTIQLGSYGTEDAAERIRAQIPDSWVQKVEVDGRTYYRVNYGRYRSRDDAAGDVEKLESEGVFGFVKTLAEAG